MTFKEKIQNFWYYYKNYLLVGVLLILALLIGINSCVNRKSYDLSVLYVTYADNDTFFRSRELSELFDSYTVDSNGDELANSQIITINYADSFQQSNSAGAQRAANLASGKCVLLLLDQRNYDELKSGGFLADISDLGDSEYLAEDAFDAYGSGFLNSLSENVVVKEPHYLCLRVDSEITGGNDSDFKLQYETAKQTLKNIIEKY
ncbi:MAG: hypothetical protein IJ408_00670 [Clostridia bacterium]|nr:hypothetical protein [Clostridia bacterium]